MIERISNIGFRKTVDMIRAGRAGVVMCCTMNEIVMANSDMEVSAAMCRADLLTPDGMPLVWSLRWKYGKVERVYGPDIMECLVKNNDSLLEAKAKQMFLGDEKNERYFKKWGHYLTLPYKDSFTEKDYSQIAKKIISLKVDIIWVGLGARKQILMADGLKRHGVRGSVVTVGAAFDFLSGQIIQAPNWVRKMGLEWLFRLGCEPRRLTHRYANIIYFLLRQLTHYLLGHVKIK